MVKKVTSIGLVFAAVAVVVYLGLTLGDAQPEPLDAQAALDETAKGQLAHEEALSLIAAESEMLDSRAVDNADEAIEPLPQATAPPGFVPAPAIVQEATPPDGYSFTGYHEVARGPMTAEDLDRENPVAPTPEWLTLNDDALAELASRADREWSFGWIKLAEGADLAGLEALLATHGGAVIGRAGDLVRARLPGDPSRLGAITAADSVVAGMGAVPAEQKITDTLSERAAANAHEEVPVWITLMSDDPDGQWRQALKQLGAEVGRFDPAVRTYAATIPLTALTPISQADFVLAVESIGRVERTLEIAAPAMGADAVRSYDAGMETFVGVGGASVTVGVMDSGFNIDHPDLSSNRRSICGANFTNFFDARAEDQDLWLDFGQHGSHVTGIVVGNGADVRDRAGIAPLVQDLRIAKSVSSYGSASALGWNRAMDWFATPTACGGDTTARKALVINSSLGASSDIWEGRSVVERKIDASVWAARHLFATSAGNGDTRVMTNMAAAKNALSVGATQNIGDIAAFSSQGPTYDGRLLPKVVGTGVSVASARGRGATSGYRVLSGTSMSSPAVVGVAALVMDAVPELKEEPAALAARLMASAVKPDAFLDDATAFPFDNTNGPGTINNVFGLGKVSARTAVLNHDTEDGWTGGSAAFDVDASSHAYHDIVVPEGASRLDIVMTWTEPPAESISSPVLHDLDLWVDRGASCGDIAACGHYNSRSRIDNVEWVIVPNPPAGVYRLKVLPNRIYGAAPRAGLAWTVIRGDSSPTLAVAADSDHVEVGPDVPFEVEVTVSSDSYVAAGANLRVECRTEVGSTACDELSYTPDESMVHREDGLERNLTRDTFSVVVGEIGPAEEQTVTLGFDGQPEGSFRLHLTASGWNAESGETSVAVVVGEADMPPPVYRPPNDDFAMAMELDGMGGETTFDLVAATPDPGEPAFAFVRGHPLRARSIWYVWTAPETGLARFAVAQSVAGDHSDYVIVDVFRDGPMAGLEALGDGQLGGGKTFFAEEGETYRVRLSTHALYLADRRSALPDLTLSWGPGSRPDNDDYAHAAAMEGESGTVSGTNAGATSEPAELMGNSSATSPFVLNGWAASVWYRWTAPSTGDYQFSVNRTAQVVAAFEGDSMAAARMVSGVPAQGGDMDEAIVFPATEGVEYRIAVASGSAYWAGTEFELSWAPGAREFPANDDVAAASLAFGNFAFGSVAFNDKTVEHGEPAASGVRTVWWKWQPGEDGRYTWLATRVAGFINDEAPLQMSVFAGNELSTLELVAMDEGTETQDLQLAFDAKADTGYHVALGLPRDAAQTRLPSAFMLMEWGPTPENDDFANATALAGMSGSVAGSNEFATNEPSEHTGSLGDSSLWWTLAPEESGWVRFELDGPRGSKLAIYRVGADGGLELVRVSRNLGNVAATVRLEAGENYVIRLGSYAYDANGLGGAGRGAFELAWAPSDPPAVLRYVDSVEDGQVADNGAEIELGGLDDQAFNGDGTELYAASDGAIMVFERDPATGKVGLMGTVEDFEISDPDARLIWDEAGSALLVTGCEEWAKFTAADGGGIQHVGSIEGAPCPVGDVLVHGDLVHHVMAPYLIETFEFDEGHDSLSPAGISMIPDVTNAVITADGENIYALAGDDESTLIAIERDAETGALRISTIIQDGSPVVGEEGATVEGLADARSLAVHGSHLFISAGSVGADTLVFDLADRANPAFLGSQDSFKASSFGSCNHAFARDNVSAVDVACANAEYFTVQVGSDGSVFGSDLVRGLRTDSFGNTVPDNDDIYSVGASPDGRHLYVSGSVFFFIFDPNVGFLFGDRYQLMVFERVGEE
ncbi:MAG: S8 family serine peptidase [Gammaproteobacteria bacterium]|nr:S8 family serine peptidase [Gammaproteobacteria bacterium]